MPIVRPASDVAAGGWLTDQGASTGLAARLSEVTPDEATAIFSPVSPGGAACTISLASLTVDPPSGACTVRYHYGKDAAGGERIDLRVELLDQDGSTVLQTWNHADIALAPQAATQTFTADLAPGAYPIRLTAWAVRLGAVSAALPALAIAATGTAPVQTATRYTVTPASLTPAAGSADLITAQLVNGAGVPVAQAGRVVTWTKSGGGSFNPTTSTTNASGVATTTLTCPTTTGSLTVTGTDTAGLTGTSSAIGVVAGPVSAAHSTVVAAPASLPADGVSIAVVTLWACDQYGNHRTTSGGTWVPQTDAGVLGAVTDYGDGHQAANLTASSSVATATITGTLAGAALPTCPVTMEDVGWAVFTASASADNVNGAVVVTYDIEPEALVDTVTLDLFDVEDEPTVPTYAGLAAAGSRPIGIRCTGSQTPVLTARDAEGRPSVWRGAPVLLATPPTTTVPAPSVVANPDVVVDRNTTLQTMDGWEAAGTIGFGHPQYDTLRPLTQDQIWTAARDLNVTRLRIELLDNIMTGPGTFDFTELDRRYTDLVNPMIAAGSQLVLNFCYVDFYGGDRPLYGYIGSDSGRYSDMVLAVYQHLVANRWQLPDYWTIILEPDNSTPFGGRGVTYAAGGALIGACITATAAKLQAASLPVPRFVAPSCADASRVVTYWNALGAQAQALVDTIDFHWYAARDQATLEAIAALGKKTAMSEGMGFGVDALIASLRWGRVSSFQQYALAYPKLPPASGGNPLYWNVSAEHFMLDWTDVNAPVLVTDSRTRHLRGFYKYVQPGAMRLAVTDNLAALNTFAWRNPDGTHVVATYMTGERSFTINGLPPGTYRGEYVVTTGVNTVMPNGYLPAQTITEGQALTGKVPGNDAGMPCTVTLYQTGGHLAAPRLAAPHLPNVSLCRWMGNWTHAQAVKQSIAARCDNYFDDNEATPPYCVKETAVSNRMMPYTAHPLMMVDVTVTYYPETPLTRGTAWKQHMEAWYAAHPEYVMESAFLHEYGQPADFAHRRKCRIYNNLTTENRWVCNPADPGFLAYTISRLADYMIYLEGATPDAYERDGVFIDELTKVLGSSKDDNGKYIFRTTDQYPDSSYDTQCTTDIKDFFAALHAGLPGKLLYVNISGDNVASVDARNVALAAGGAAHLENLVQFRRNMPIFWPHVVALQKAGIACDTWPGADGLTFGPGNWEYTETKGYNAGNEATKGQRYRMFAFLNYLMTYVSRAASWHTIQYGQTEVNEGAAYNYCWPVFQVDLGGDPVTDYYQFTWTGMPADDSAKTRSGDSTSQFSGATGQLFRIYRRDFPSGAIALCRPRIRQDAYDPYWDDNSIVDVPLPAGTWHLIRMDGTLTGPLTSVSMRQGEGAVLLPG